MPSLKILLSAAALLAAAPAVAQAERLAAVTSTGTLLTFDNTAPQTTTSTAITGIGAGETVRGIDTRPVTEEVYLITAQTSLASGSVARTYRLNVDTGAATQVGAATAAIPGFGDVTTGYDFNPNVDRLRITTATDENFRLNPNNGALAGDDTDIASGSEILEVAYDRNVASGGGFATTLFAIDRATNALVTIGSVNGSPDSPNGGTVNAVGALGVAPDAGKSAGFDISPSAAGSAFAALTVGGVTRLYTISTTTGAATAVNTIGDGTAEVFGLTRVAPNRVGANGSNGTNGTNGANGKDGANGRDGASADKLAAAIANSAYRGRAGKNLPVRVVSTLAGVATLEVVKAGQVIASVSDAIAAGRSTLRLRNLPARGPYSLRLTVTGGGQTVSDTASLLVRKRR